METENQKPLVSVVMPAHNAALYIGQAIESVLAQTYPEIEICVADDGSTDGTEGVVGMYVAKYPDKVRLFPQNHVGRAASMRNVAMRHAHGAYIAFLDADDIWMPEKIQQQMRILKAGGCDVCFSDAVYAGGEHDGHAVSEYVRMHSGDIFPELVKGNFIVNSSVVMRRDIVDAVGFLSERNIYRNIEDYEYWLRIALARYSFSYIKAPLVRYRIHAGQHSVVQGKNARALLCLYWSYCFKPNVWARGCGADMVRMGLMYVKNAIRDMRS